MKYSFRPLPFLVLLLAIAGCAKQQEPEAPKPARVGNAPLDTYASELVKTHSAEIASFVPSFQTLQSPLSYLTVFRSNDPGMLTEKVDEGDSAGHAHNSAITSRWQQMYCSASLQSLMQREGITLSYGQIVDASGKKHSLAMCVAASPGEGPSPSTTEPGPLQQQICRATIGAIMGRDPNTITVQKVEAGVIHVSYTRPNDGTVWDQRCRFEGTRVIWATSSGRWRDQSMDEVISYGVTPAAVTITQKFSDGSSVAKSYTRADLKVK